jgi:hypothetical protein
MRNTSPAVTTALALVPDPLVESMTAGLKGSVALTVSPATVVLHALDLRGAQTRVRGELAKHGDSKSGGLLFSAGPASAGVSFEGTKATPVLVDAPGWFDTHVARRDLTLSTVPP